MTSTVRPHAVAFDVVETLFSLDAVDAALRTAGVDAQGLDRFFTRLLRDGFALAASGTHRPFPEVADAALAAVAATLDRGAWQQVRAAFGRLDPQPDARPALERLAEAGLPVAALTNGSALTTTVLLDRAGLAGLVTRVVSIDEVQQWKPAPAVYRHAAGVLGVEPHRLALVSVHSWDVHGAHHAGLTTGWAARLEGTVPAIFSPPDVTGADLVEVTDGLLALSDN